MYCKNCGKELPKGALFCSRCGQKVTELQSGKSLFKNVASNKDEAKVRQKSEKIKSIKSTKFFNKSTAWKLTVAGILLVSFFFVYKLIYIPHTVNIEVQKTEFKLPAKFKVQTKPFSKKVIIIANKPTVLNLVSIASEEGFSMRQIPTEEQLQQLDKSLPGNWDVQLIQKNYKNSSRVLWQYSDGGQPVVRYQNSSEFKEARQVYLNNVREQNATESEAQAAVRGALIGGLLGSALRR